MSDGSRFVNEYPCDFHQTKHTIIKSFEPGDEWGYCYIDQIFFESL